MKIFLSALILLFSINCFAQREHHADIAYSFGKNSFTVSGNAVKNFKLLKSEKLHLGVGARGGYSQGSGLSFLTAPAKHTKSDNGIDTVTVKKSHFIFVNLSLNASYHFTSEWSVGANMDIIGFTFANKQSSDFYPGLASQSEDPPRLKRSNELVKPARNNFFLTGDNNKGTLLSEVYVKYTLKERYSLKAGYSFITTEYTSQNRIGHNNNYRFRNTSGQVMIGFGYSFI